MRNILSYLEVIGLQDFNQRPFNEVDGLILSQLSYFKFENVSYLLEQNNSPILLSQLNDLNTIQKLTDNLSKLKPNLKLLNLVFNSIRFDDMKLNWVESSKCEILIKQFAAITFIFPTFIYIAYRGTDSSLVGWKEDFYLSTEEIIPSQIDALNYLQSVASKTYLPIYVGGHSKEGNLALYASYRVTNAVKKRIIKIYNFDGPGYKINFFDEDEFLKIRNKVCTIIPKDCIIGVLLNQLEPTIIVKAKYFLFLQHQTFNWLLDKNFNFKTVKKASYKSKILSKTLNQFSLIYSEENKKRLIEIIFLIFQSKNIVSLSKILNNPFRYSFNFIFFYLFKLNNNDKIFLKEARREWVKLMKNK